MFIKRDDLVEVEENSETPSGYFSTKEIDEVNKEFVNYLNYGGYPEAVLSEAVREDPAQYIKSDIIDKVLLRDLPSLYGISDIQELNRLFTTLAYNSGREVSLEGLATSSGVAKNTIRRYIEYLEAAFLIQRIERIDNNAKRFKRAMCFKVYLNNPSMRAALFGQVSMDSDAMGALTETAIFSQWQHNLAASLYYARWNSGEVDVVYMAGSELKPAWAVEIKWSDRPTTDYKLLDNCVEFGKRHNLLARFLVTTKTVTQQAVTYKGISFYFLPSALYAYTLGANILNNINKNMESDNLVE
jgi:predicted AAA+ superfamily ATPase